MPVISSSVENPDLSAERQRANFSTDALAAVIWEGAERFRRRREIAAYVARHAELQPHKPEALMSREERMESVSIRTVAGAKHAPKAIDETKPEEHYYYYTLVLGIDGTPFGLHYGMGMPTMMNTCDEEQAAEWLPKMLARQINVVYAQTEIGHGTNLKNLETTALFDASRDEFVLDTPTVTATKFWPGNMGKVATHAIVVAQLLTLASAKDGGTCGSTRVLNHGPHLFLVPLRDLDSHLLLPGVTTGDIGTKFGINTNDNGFLRLHKVRIPRRNMLMRHAQVTKTGEYIRPIHSKANYTGMMYVRSMMITGMAIHLASAATIAIRYSCVRRQGEITPGEGEVKVLDYQTQQHRLFPQLARAFAFLFAGSHIRQLYFNVMSDLKSGSVGVMADLHGLGSGLKAQVSHHTALGIEQCRMACGGHGYSNASGIPLIYTTAVGGCTYEGENMVMLLQLGRFLLKRAQEIRSPVAKIRTAAAASAGPFTQYYFAGEDLKQTQNLSLRYPKTFLRAFEHLSLRLTLLAFDRLEALKANGLTHEVAWNETAVDWTKAARAHTRTFLARNFVESVEKVGDSGVRAVLIDLLHLFLAYELMDCSGSLMEDGWLDGAHLAQVREDYYATLKRIRPQAVPIVDSFAFCDRELDSVLGREDGNVYDNLLKWAEQSSLNKTEVTEFHKKSVLAEMKKARQNNDSKI